MNPIRHVIEWLGLDPRPEDTIADSLYEDARAFYDEAKEAEAELAKATALLIRCDDDLRKTKAALTFARRDNAHLRRLVLAYDAVLPAEERSKVAHLALAVDRVFEQMKPLEDRDEAA